MWRRWLRANSFQKLLTACGFPAVLDSNAAPTTALSPSSQNLNPIVFSCSACFGVHQCFPRHGGTEEYEQSPAGLLRLLRQVPPRLVKVAGAPPQIPQCILPRVSAEPHGYRLRVFGRPGPDIGCELPLPDGFVAAERLSGRDVMGNKLGEHLAEEACRSMGFSAAFQHGVVESNLPVMPLMMPSGVTA